MAKWSSKEDGLQRQRVHAVGASRGWRHPKVGYPPLELRSPSLESRPARVNLLSTDDLILQALDELNSAQLSHASLQLNEAAGRLPDTSK